jgi:sodium-dependent phosphate cotransporter
VPAGTAGTQVPHRGLPGIPLGLQKALAVIVLLFIFLVGVKGLGDSFQLLGRDFVDSFFRATSNPFVALMVGILATTLVQSSSVTTSMIVGLVAASEDPLPLVNAVPMIMGANIGTTVTNTIVSLAHMRRRDEFVRAFSVATTHDFFNFLAVAILLPVELATGFLRRTASFIASRVGTGIGGIEYDSPLKEAIKAVLDPIKHSSAALVDSQTGQAIILIGVSVAFIYLALVLVVRVMRSVMESQVERFVTRALGSNVLLSLLLGAVATVMVQSSSITTALLVPIAGAGLITVREAFPITVGANIGTTVTALLASLALSGENAQAGLTIALVHLLFNISGTLIVVPIPQMRRIPVEGARWLAETAARSRRWALLYVLIIFYLLPGLLALGSKLLK